MNEYHITGRYTCKGQVQNITGIASVTDEGYLEAKVTETPSMLTYDLEGAIMVLDTEMMIDAKEVGKKNNVPSITYFLYKKINNPAEASMEGTYTGDRHSGLYLTSDFDKAKGPKTMTREDIIKVSKSIKVNYTEEPVIASITLKRRRINTDLQ